MPRDDYEDDELNKRQKRREKLRQQRLREQQRMKRKLMIALLVLLACGAGIFLIARNSFGFRPVEMLMQTEPPTQPVSTRPADRPTEPKETQPPRYDPVTTIHIRAAGDLNVTNEAVNAGLVGGGYDYTQAFIDVASILSDADLTMLNFEGNVCGQPYGSETRSAPPELLTGLVNAGVDVLQTANSYSVYNGLIGLDATLQSIRNAGLVPLGSFASPQEFKRTQGYVMVDVQGIRIALVGFTKGVGGMGMPAGNEECVNLLYEDYDETYKKVNTKGITKVLRAAAAEKPDITIAMLHWGSEYNDEISKTQTEIVELMMAEGVSVIIGTHPHTVQWVDFDKDAGTLIAYSLGDFFGDATRAGTNYSIILDVEITKDESLGTTRVTGFDYIPIYTLNPAAEGEEESGLSRQVVRIRTAMSARQGNFVDRINKGAYDSMEYSLKRIHERIEGIDQDPEQIAEREEAEKKAKKEAQKEAEKQKKEEEKRKKK